MDAGAVRRVIHQYREVFQALELEPVSYSHERPVPAPRQALSHCYAMLEQMEDFVAAGRMEKAFRWLGFVQGVLWANGVFTIEELKQHNILLVSEET